MGRWNTAISDEALELARRLRADGRGWQTVERIVGFSEHILRSRLDPLYYADLNERIRERRVYVRKSDNHVAEQWHISPAEVERLRTLVPPDTRTLTARAFGDPLPGRSALDAKGSAEPPKARRAHDSRGRFI